jgi:hypothetical protein
MKGDDMRKLLLSASLCALCAAYAHGAFTKRIAFTTSGYGGDSALANFPVLVKLPGTINGFDYADFGGTTNLVFKDSAGNAIPYEVDTWNTAGTSLVWVRVPSVTKTTVFHMYYCGSDNAAKTPTAVWTAANYVGVWHMDETSGTVADATGHGLTATPMGDASVSVRYSGTDAPIGHARQTGTSSAKGYLTIADNNLLDVGDTFTMSGWVYFTDIQSGKAERIFSRKGVYSDQNGWEIEMNAGSDNAFTARGSHKDNGKSGGGATGCTGNFKPSLKNKWTHVAVVYNGTQLTVCSNGYEIATGTISAVQDNDNNLSIGCNATGTEAGYFHGYFDECRLLDAVASADWIAAEYATVASDTFVTAGDIEDVGAKPGMAIFVR